MAAKGGEAAAGKRGDDPVLAVLGVFPENQPDLPSGVTRHNRRCAQSSSLYAGRALI